MHCFTAENARLFLQKKPRQTEAVKWFLNTVIPEAEEIGRRKAADRMERQAPSVDVNSQETPDQESVLGREAASFADRLDAIILECALLKRELMQAR